MSLWPVSPVARASRSWARGPCCAPLAAPPAGVAAHGWGIELLCVREYPNGLYLPLEDVIDSVTFVKGGRRSTGLTLTARHLAAPAPAPRQEVPRGHAQATTAINVSRDRALDVLTEMQQEHLIGSARLDETGQPTWQLSATDIAAVVQRFGGAA